MPLFPAVNRVSAPHALDIGLFKRGNNLIGGRGPGSHDCICQYKHRVVLLHSEPTRIPARLSLVCGQELIRLGGSNTRNPAESRQRKIGFIFVLLDKVDSREVIARRRDDEWLVTKLGSLSNE